VTQNTTTTGGGAVPPKNLEAEQSVLGSMLLDRDAIARIVEVLQPADFYVEKHRVLFAVMVELFERGEPVDLLTVTTKLTALGRLDQAGGLPYVSTLPAAVPAVAHGAHYAELVRHTSARRALLVAGHQIVGLGQDGTAAPDELIDQAEALLFAIRRDRTAQTVRSFSTVLKETMDILECRYQEKGPVTGVAGGVADLDHLTTGWQPGDLILLAARPSMGKTTMAIDFCRHAALRQKIPVVFFSLEMHRTAIMERILSAEAKIPLQQLRTGLMSDADWARLSPELGPISEMREGIDDTPSLTVLEIRARARRLRAEGKCDLVIIDYLGLVQPRTRRENRVVEMGEVARDLKSLAKELEVPVIALSQLSRAGEQGGAHRPQLHHLRDSGELEQVADLVILLYRDDYYDLERAQREGKEHVCEVIVAKHRNGPTGMVEVFFDKEYARFRNLEQQHEEMAR
jgi:replicative DNA helicase